MDSTVVALVVLLVTLVALDLAALRYGVNSRDGQPEYPVWSTERPYSPESGTPRHQPRSDV